MTEAIASSRSSVSLFGAIAIGVGGMVGGGIFAALGLAATMAGGATPLALLIAGLVALVTCYAYAKLSVSYASSGGTIVYLNRVFGVGMITGSINNLLWLSYVITLSLYAAAFANYASTFFGEGVRPWLEHSLITLAIIGPTALNLASPSLVSRSEVTVVVIKILILLGVIGASIGSIDTQRLAVDTWSGPISIVSAGMMVFVAYEGFELIANTTTEMENPRRDAPRAFYIAVVFTIILYLLIAAVTVGALSPEAIAAKEDFALAAAAEPALGRAGFILVSISALLATFSAINATLYGSSRLACAIADEGELPRALTRRLWGQPIAGLLATSAGAVLLSNLVPLERIATLGSLGFLLVFAAVNAACARAANDIGARRWISVLGCVACVIALIILVVQSAIDDPTNLIMDIAILAIPITAEWANLRWAQPHNDAS